MIDSRSMAIAIAQRTFLALSIEAASSGLPIHGNPLSMPSSYPWAIHYAAFTVDAGLAPVVAGHLETLRAGDPDLLNEAPDAVHHVVDDLRRQRARVDLAGAQSGLSRGGVRHVNNRDVLDVGTMPVQ